MSSLKEAFATSDLPYIVDVLDWHASNQEVKDEIEKCYEIIKY